MAAAWSNFVELGSYLHEGFGFTAAEEEGNFHLGPLRALAKAVSAVDNWDVRNQKTHNKGHTVHHVYQTLLDVLIDDSIDDNIAVDEWLSGNGPRSLNQAEAAEAKDSLDDEFLKGKWKHYLRQQILNNLRPQYKDLRLHILIGLLNQKLNREYRLGILEEEEGTGEAMIKIAKSDYKGPLVLLYWSSDWNWHALESNSFHDPYMEGHDLGQYIDQAKDSGAAFVIEADQHGGEDLFPEGVVVRLLDNANPRLVEQLETGPGRPEVTLRQGHVSKRRLRVIDEKRPERGLRAPRRPAAERKEKAGGAPAPPPETVELIMYYTITARTHKTVDHRKREVLLSNVPDCEKLTYGKHQPMLHVEDLGKNIIVRDVYGREGIVPRVHLEGPYRNPWGISERIEDTVPRPVRRRSYVGNPYVRHWELQNALKNKNLKAWGNYDQLRQRLLLDDIVKNNPISANVGKKIKMAYVRVEPKGEWHPNLDKFIGFGDAFPLPVLGPRSEQPHFDGHYVRILEEEPETETTVVMNLTGHQGRFNTKRHLRYIEDAWRIRLPAPEDKRADPEFQFEDDGFIEGGPVWKPGNDYGDIRLGLPQWANPPAPF